MVDDRVLQAMRLMAWERAKGELESILQTYYDGDDRFAEVNHKFAEFIALIEDHGIGGLG
jgi:hypothetical protein